MKTKFFHLQKNGFGAFRTLLLIGLVLLFAASGSLVKAAPLNRFRILIGTNQMKFSEIQQMNQYPFNPLAVDGVWAVPQNNCGLNCGPPLHCINDGFSMTNQDVPPSAWPNVFLKLNGANWTISEDEAIWLGETLNNNAQAASQSYIAPAPVRDALAYYEYFPVFPPKCEGAACGPIISPEQIEDEVALFGERIIFLTRDYREADPPEEGAAYWVRQALSAPHAAGVVVELGPDAIINDTPDHRKAVEAINYTLGLGKNAYLLLPPNQRPDFPPNLQPYMHRNNHGGFPNYSADIVEVLTYLNSREVPLNNPNLFIVLAAYGRDENPPPRPNCTPTPGPTPPGWLACAPGFMTGEGGTGFNNSIWAAAEALQTYRNTILPQPTMGYIDSVSSSGASGWTLDPETFAASSTSIAVHLYVDGGTFVGSATANIPRPDVNAATGFLGNHGFTVPIPSQYLDSHSHQWSAYGISASGQSGKNSLLGNSPITVTLPDTIAPTVSITAPFNGQYVAGTFTVSANASDNAGVLGVQFKLDGNNLGNEDTTPPYSVNWNTTTASPGTHTLTAVARDAVNTTTSAPITVTVDNTPPSGVNLTAPFNNQFVAGTAVPVSGTASDTNMDGVQFQLDGGNLGTLDKTVPYTLNWDTTTAPQTTHTLRAVAKDKAGNTTTSPSVTVTVDNTAPTGVFVTAPANGATVSNTVTVSGTASDANMNGVQFQVDGANLGTLDKTVPYSVSWNTVPYPSGTHTVRAVATDKAGNTTTSPTITVTVNNNSQ